MNCFKDIMNTDNHCMMIEARKELEIHKKEFNQNWAWALKAWGLSAQPPLQL